MGLIESSDYHEYELLDLARLNKEHWTAKILVTSQIGWIRKTSIQQTFRLFCRCYGDEIHKDTPWYDQDDGTEFNNYWVVSRLAMRHLRLERFHEAD